MLTIQDFQNLLALISSDALSITGNNARGVAVLQEKLARTIDEARKAPADATENAKKDTDGDSTRPAE